MIVPVSSCNYTSTSRFCNISYDFFRWCHTT